jgi:acetolactate synthase I/II/III large subunit
VVSTRRQNNIARRICRPHMETLAERVVGKLVAAGVRHVFSVPGGSAMHLNDAFARHPDITVVYQHHEQACGYSAIGYAKATGRLACVCTTSGCGITNAVTAINSAWQDSVGVVFLSGQVDIADVESRILPNGNRLRSVFSSDVDICELVKTIVKGCSEPTTATDCLAALDRLITVATSNRNGPVVLSVPLGLQAKDVSDLSGPAFAVQPALTVLPSATDMAKLARLASQSTRPLVLLGGGVSAPRCREQVREFVSLSKIPTICSWFAMDVIPTDSAEHCGRIGILGERCGNYLVQHCDLLIVLGCRLTKAHAGYRPDMFAPGANIVVVDIDKDELLKTVVNITLPIHADVGSFIDSYIQHPVPSSQWLDVTAAARASWLGDCPASAPLTTVHNICQYALVASVGRARSDSRTTYIACSGSLVNTTFHVLSLGADDRYITSNQAEMGYELPAAIGCAIGDPSKKVIAFVGDGSLQFNVQELNTIAGHHLDIALIVVNNNGYATIANTQSKYFGHIEGCTPETGLRLPILSKIAVGFGIPYTLIANSDGLHGIGRLLSERGPRLIEVRCPPSERHPKLGVRQMPDRSFVSRPFDDMDPPVPPLQVTRGAGRL